MCAAPGPRCSGSASSARQALTDEVRRAQGSGKSNLMDAISFVLGVRTAHLRGSLRELLYANSEAGDEGQARRGLVKLVFETGAGEEVEFARVIVPSGGAAGGFASKYRIDGREVRWEDYNARLQSYGILVQARNFLVFQARLAHAAARSGPDGSPAVRCATLWPAAG